MTGKPKILIIEDDTPVAMMMVFLLARADCITEVATTGEKAMKLAETGNFDLITLDVDLPDANATRQSSLFRDDLANKTCITALKPEQWITFPNRLKLLNSHRAFFRTSKPEKVQ